MNMFKLSEKQTEVVDFMQAYQNENGHMPTLREIAEHLQVTVPTAHEHVQAIKMKGWVAQVNYCPTCGKKLDES